MNDKRSIIAIVVCGLLYAGYMYQLQQRYPDFGKPKTALDQPLETPSTTANPAAPTGASSVDPTKPETTISTSPAVVSVPAGTAIENDDVKVEFAEKGTLAHIWLKRFDESAQKHAPTIDLAGKQVAIAALSDPQQTSPDELTAFNIVSPTQVVVTTKSGAWEKTLTYALADNYSIGLKATYKNIGSEGRDLNSGLRMQHHVDVVKSSSGLLPSGDKHKKHLVNGIDGSRSAVVLDEYCSADHTDPAFYKENVSVDFAGIDFHYFLTVIIPEVPTQTLRTYKTAMAPAGANCEITTALWQPQGMIRAGESVTNSFNLYVGPKDVDRLAAASPRLHETVDFGWFAMIGRPLLIAVKSINSFVTHNYGLAIILLTILLKLAFYPLTRAAAISMKKMQKFTPEINRLKEKYKDDRQAQQRELMQFMSANKINPAKGCLPILPQIPVFIAFYNVLSQSIELRQAPFYGWIRDLSVADPFYVTPILLGAGMVLQQRLTPNPTMDKTQEKIMMIVPFMFTFMMLTLPAGMVLYMLTNTIVSICQQQWLNRSLKV